jgi:transcriptional regulator with XRE-family HTH domain
LTFQDAQLRLLAYVRGRIQSGELTERGFARRIGISQPHVHNVLKGVRNLSPEVFDITLKYFHLSILDLAPQNELESSLAKRRASEPSAEIPFLASSVGPDRPWPTAINWRRSFPVPVLPWNVRPDWVMAELAVDSRMLLTIGDFDIAFLDTSEEARHELSANRLYVVDRPDGTLLRFIRPGGRGSYLADDASIDKPMEWERLDVSPAELREIVKACVRWLGRERDRTLPAPQRGRFL